MTAALKMAAPGELSVQIVKLMKFCKDQARSIRTMRHHLAITEAAVKDLLAQALEKKLLWKQSNGMYKTVNTKFALIEHDLPANDTANEQPADNSMLALAASETTAADISEQRVTAVLETQPIEHRGEHHLAKAIEQLEQLDHQQDDTVDIDEELNALLDLQLVKADGEMLQLNEPASTNALLDAELTTLAEMLDPNQYPVIDDIDSKQHALAGIAVLLKQRTPALARLADQLATDLSVIRLHQERRA